MVEQNKGFLFRMAESARGAIARWTGPTPAGTPEVSAPSVPTDPSPNTDGGTMDEASSSGRRFITSAMLAEWTQSAAALLHETWDYNPDDLVQQKGKHIKVYQEMLRDPYVKAGLLIKKLSVLRLPVEVLPASDDAQDQEIAKFIEEQLETMDTPWHTLLMGVMDSLDCGYSIGEINYRIVERGDYKGSIGWDSIKSKDPYVYSFRIKKNGNVDKVVQRLAVAAVMRNLNKGDLDQRYGEYPPHKFLISSFQPKYNNPYGMSDLRAAYRAFFIKDWAWKFRAIFMEKWGSPTVVGSFPNGTSPDRRKQLEEVLESIQQETTLTIPEDLKIELIRVATTANITEYERSIADLNKEILVGLMGSFLAVEEGKRTGARSQGQVHLWIAKLFVEALVYHVQEDLNRQMVRRLVDMNYPDIARYPKVKFEMSRVEELLMEMELDTGLQKMGFPIDEEYVAKKYGRPVRAKGASRSVNGVADGDGSSGVLVPLDVQKSKMQAEEKRKAIARGEDPGAAGPDDAPRSNLSENFEGVFETLRGKALPTDHRKIGPLKETYGHLVRTWGALRGVDKFSEADTIAFALAGEEREYHEKVGMWPTQEQAYAAFLKRMLKG